MDKERLEQEIECMLKYVKTLEQAKNLLAHKERLLARVLDDNKWLERDYYEIEEENENLKAQLKNLKEKEKVFSREFAIKQLKEIKKLFEGKYSYDVPESDFAIIYEIDIDKIIDNQINKLKGAINE